MAKEIAMWHESFNQLLAKSLESHKRRNPRFSQRAFAKKLGVSCGMLSDVTNGKSRFTKERALDILSQLNVSAKEKARFKVLLGKADEVTENIPVSEKYLILYDWNYRAILFAFDIEKFSVSANILSEMLSQPLAQVEKRVEELIDLGLLLKDDDGKISRSKVIWKVPEKSSKEFAHKLYQTNLDLAKKAIKGVPATERDFSTITFAGNSTQLGKLRSEIQDLCQKAIAIMEEPGTDQVYQMSVFVHPLLHPGLNNEN